VRTETREENGIPTYVLVPETKEELAWLRQGAKVQELYPGSTTKPGDAASSVEGTREFLMVYRPGPAFVFMRTATPLKYECPVCKKMATFANVTSHEATLSPPETEVIFQLGDCSECGRKVRFGEMKEKPNEPV